MWVGGALLEWGALATDGEEAGEWLGLSAEAKPIRATARRARTTIWRAIGKWERKKWVVC